MRSAGKSMLKWMKLMKREWMKKREGGNDGLARRKERRVKVYLALSDLHHEDTVGGTHFWTVGWKYF